MNMRMRRTATAVGLVLGMVLTACGGGGGGGDDPPPTSNDRFPVLVRGGDFDLSAPPSPADHAAVAGRVRGQVLARTDQPAVAGVRVELLDATDPRAPVVRASGLTDAQGRFDMADALAGLPPADRWIRTTLDDGTVLRGHAIGWTDLSPASEHAVAELARLERAGAVHARRPTADELAALQGSLGLVWQAGFGARPPADALAALASEVRTRAAWNSLLSGLAQAQPVTGAGDVAGLVPVGQATWTSVVTRDAVSTPVEFVGHREMVDGSPQYAISAYQHDQLVDSYRVGPAGVTRIHPHTGDEVLDALITQAGPLPLFEYPPQVGSRVVIDAPRLVLTGDERIHAAVKVTRHTHAMADLAALGRTVRAFEVLLDYEVAILDTATGTQRDVLMRERRWFHPGASRVRQETTLLHRDAAGVRRTNLVYRASAVQGSIWDPAVLPTPGVADVRAIGLRHRHAVPSPDGQWVYAVVSDGGGQLLELDASRLTVRRRTALGATPVRVAVSADGAVLYVGLEGGQVVQLDAAGLQVTRRFDVAASPWGLRYDVILDLAVDPLDASRLLSLTSGGDCGSDGRVQTHRAGVLEIRGGPDGRAGICDGWSHYSPTHIAWSGTSGEFFALSDYSPPSVHRFGVRDGEFRWLASRARDADVGLHEVGGDVVGRQGTVLDGATLTPQRQLRLPPFALEACTRLDLASNLCEALTGEAISPPVLVHLEHASGDFLGTYRPVVGEVTNGCPEVPLDVDSYGLTDRSVAPMAGGRMLVRAVADAQGNRCALHMWTLRGVAP